MRSEACVLEHECDASDLHQRRRDRPEETELGVLVPNLEIAPNKLPQKLAKAPQLPNVLYQGSLNSVMGPGCQYTWLALAVSIVIGSSPCVAQQSASRPASPLAYVRRLVVLPFANALETAGNQGVTKNMRRTAADLAPVLRTGLQIAEEELSKRLEASGVVLSGIDHPRTGVERRPFSGIHEPRMEELVEAAGSADGDAALFVLLDKAGVRTGLYRELWIRLRADLVSLREPTHRYRLYALGAARTAPKVFAAGFVRTDDDLVRDAALSAARNLYDALDRGGQAPFAVDARIAVIPAAVPATADVRSATGEVVNRLPVPQLERQADVLFQPEVGPLAEVVPAASVIAGMRELGLTPSDFWLDGAPVVAAAASLGRHIGADWVLLSRIEAVAIGPALDELTGEEAGEAGEVMARFALLQVATGRVSWQCSKRALARTTMQTPYGRRPIRTKQQAVTDAATTVYALARQALEEWARSSRILE